MNLRSLAIVVIGTALLEGCATPPLIPPPLSVPRATQQNSLIAPESAAETRGLVINETPKPPAPRVNVSKDDVPLKTADTAAEPADISLSFEQVPLPTFIQSIYGTILKRNVTLDPKVADRQDLVTLRSGKPQKASEIANATVLLLKSYGIAVIDIGSLIRIIPDGGNVGYLPEIRRGRALPETPVSLRPVFYHVELKAVRNIDVVGWLRTVLGNKINIQEDPWRNALLLSGTTGDIQAALEVIDAMDQPLMSGRQSARIEPMYWSVDELARKVADLLRTEGYRVAIGPNEAMSSPITLIPMPAVNALICFTGDKKTLDHVVNWIKDLDKQSPRGAGRRFLSYQAKHIDAQLLATTLDRVLGGTGAVAGDPKAVAGAGGGKVVVNSNSNTLILQGNTDDFGQILSLLQQLDKPVREALIEVTVAEVSLKDNTQFGVEWLVNEARLSGSSVSYGTKGGLSLGSGGFNFASLNSAGDRRLLLNALASSNRATILSTPRIMARSGDSATIQVGQEVPVLTSQQTGPTTGGTGSIIQTVQYRQAGVILTVKPVIHSGEQIDLDISQEVSAAQTTNTGVSSSPTFGQRRIQTKLGLKNGSTVMLGGLISDNNSGGEAGIPLLKDIPLIGQLFRTNTKQRDRTELIMLITPYIISDDEDAVSITEAFRKRLGPWAEQSPTGIEATIPPLSAKATPPAKSAEVDAASPTTPKPKTSE